MPTPVHMPQLGESVAEGTIGRWLKSVGDRIEKDESLVEIITDKVNAEVPSALAGTVTEILAQEGETVPVGQPIAMIDEENSVDEKTVSHQSARQPMLATAGSPIARDGDSGGPRASNQDDGGGDDRSDAQRTSPLVRRLAREHGIDLAQIKGRGMAGRVTRDDVLAFLDSKPNQVAPPDQAVSGQAVASPRLVTSTDQPTAVDGSSDQEVLPLTPVRRQIAEHMVRSLREAPHVTTLFEIDMTGVARLRDSLKDEFQRREGIALTYVPFVAKAVAEALRANPILNSTWGGDKIILHKRINLGIAVGLDDGLFVPVIRDADRMTVTGLAHAMYDLIERARSAKLGLADLQGGTFTVNNTGALGSIVSTPIINQPQAAIVTMEAIVRRPVVIEDAIAIRSMMNMCLSFDHRILDGVQAGRFMQMIKKQLEAFAPGQAI